MDPFKIEGPAIINVSGGRTSALMLRRILDAHGGRLPDDVHAVFANTGKERPETLDFVRDLSERWGVDLRWIERAPGGGFREVTHETASRDGEPLATLFRERKFIPNGVMRFCTVAAKIEPANAFMRAREYEHWTSVLGLRFDEPHRVAKARGPVYDEVDVVCPLHSARVTKVDVMAYWQTQPFDLALRPWEGNCDGCFLKSASILERVERDHPGTLDWWRAQEERVGATFAKGRPVASIIARARLPMLPGLAADPPDEETSIPCNCTD